MPRFQRKKYLNRIKWTIVALFALGFIALLFMPISMGGDYKRSSREKVALNFAATVAQSAGNYYVNTQIKDFVGNQADFGKRIFISKDNSIVAPEDYNCLINDSSVVVTHKDGAKAEVRWR